LVVKRAVNQPERWSRLSPANQQQQPRARDQEPEDQHPRLVQRRHDGQATVLRELIGESWRSSPWLRLGVIEELH
jgi:hypothetical protein